MRRITITLILSLFLAMGSGVAYADRHNDNHHRYEQREKGRKNHHRDFRPRHGNKRHYAPVPLPPPHLCKMVRYATRGSRDVAVWQISPDTYIVKYRKGNRYYTRRLYPYSNRYGTPNHISVNWVPKSPWTFIPSINVNIDL